MSRRSAVVLCMVGLLLAAVCATYPAQTAQEENEAKLSTYLPLEEGRYYRFEVLSETKGYAQRSTEWTNLAPRELNGRTVVPRRITPDGGNSVISLLQDDGDAIWFVGHQPLKCPTPVTVRQPVCLLKAPLVVGATWSTVMYLPGSSEPTPIRSTIESVNELVTVPAGTFKKCLRIHSTDSTGQQKVDDLTWYAPNVGVVKFTRKVQGSAAVAAQLSAYK